MKKISNLAGIFAFIVLLSGRALAGEPTAQLSATINEFVTILVHTPVAQLRASGLPDNAMALVLSRFDFSEMTKRSLGSHWQLWRVLNSVSLSMPLPKSYCALTAGRYVLRVMREFNMSVSLARVLWRPSRQKSLAEAATSFPSIISCTMWMVSGRCTTWSLIMSVSSAIIARSSSV
jgi:hypothetical protein